MADNTDVTTIHSIPHSIPDSVLHSQPDMTKTLDNETENDNNTETDELDDFSGIADKDDSLHHSSPIKVTVPIVWFNKVCLRTNFIDAEKEYNMAINKVKAQVCFNTGEILQIFSKDMLHYLQPVLRTKSNLVNNIFFKALQTLLTSLTYTVTADLQLACLTKVMEQGVYWPSIAKSMGFTAPSPTITLNQVEGNFTPFHIIGANDHTDAIAELQGVTSMYMSQMEERILQIAKHEAVRQLDNLVVAFGRRFKGKLNSDLFKDIEQEIAVSLADVDDHTNINAVMKLECSYLKKSFDVLADFLIVFAVKQAIHKNRVLLRAMFASTEGCIPGP
jgi:hypothetical protein